MLRCYVAKELNNVDASRQFRSSRAYGKLESMFVRSIYFNPNYFFSVLLALLTWLWSFVPSPAERLKFE